MPDEEHSYTKWKTAEQLIGELDGNQELFEHWVSNGAIVPSKDGLFNYSLFLRLRAELTQDMTPGFRRFDNIKPS
jgi:hypothetical protein